jgi:hypothetical protein
LNWGYDPTESPVIADKAYDSDELRQELDQDAECRHFSVKSPGAAK